MAVFKNPLLRILFFLIILMLVGIVGYKKIIGIKQNNSYPPLSLNKPSPTPSLLENDVHSIDGTLKLIMRILTLQGDTKTYSFFVADIYGNNERSLFAKTLNKNTTMMIPENSWSPDNKYVFIRQNQADLFEIFVLKANGEVFASGQQYLDVISLFAQRKMKYSIIDVTGWDSSVLLHIRTTGPNYWFDVTSSAFMQLSS